MLLGRFEIRVSPVQPGAFDFPGDRLRNHAADLLAAADAGPNIARRNVHRRNLEELDPLRALELREHGLERFARVSGPRGPPR